MSWAGSECSEREGFFGVGEVLRLDVVHSQKRNTVCLLKATELCT